MTQNVLKPEYYFCWNLQLLKTAHIQQFSSKCFYASIWRDFVSWDKRLHANFSASIGCLSTGMNTKPLEFTKTVYKFSSCIMNISSISIAVFELQDCSCVTQQFLIPSF